VDIVGNGNAVDKVTALAVQPDGKIVVVGYTRRFPRSQAMTSSSCASHTDGSADAGFGTGAR